MNGTLTVDTPIGELERKVHQLERERNHARRICDEVAEAAGFAKTYDPSMLPGAVKFHIERLHVLADGLQGPLNTAEWDRDKFGVLADRLQQELDTLKWNSK
jgi:hypothetical protein